MCFPWPCGNFGDLHSYSLVVCRVVPIHEVVVVVVVVVVVGVVVVGVVAAAAVGPVVAFVVVDVGAGR